MTTNQVLQGQSTPTRSIYQWAQPDFEVATISIHLDEDLNPLNTNQTLLQEIIVPGTGASFVGVTLTNITLAASNATPGRHALLATISANGRTRHLYAPEFVEVIALAQPPALGIALMSGTQFRIGVAGAAGQTLVLHYSTNLQDWLPLATNMLAGTNLWLYTNAPPASPAQSYYRAELLQ
jgi:hypothetical protein